MSMQCEICHKKAMRGNLVSHSKQRTHRMFKPNLHQVKTMVSGGRQTLRVCTKCLRRLKKPFVSPEIKKEEIKVKQAEQVKKEAPKLSENKVKEVKVKTTTIAELMKESQEGEKKTEKEAKKATPKIASKKKKAS